MKCFAAISFQKLGWIEIEKPKPGPLDAIIRPIAISPCTSDIHTAFDNTTMEVNNVVLGHEAVGEIVEIGAGVKDFKPGDRVIVPGMTPDWLSLEVQTQLHQHSNGLLGGFKFSTQKPGVFADLFHVNQVDMNVALMPDGMSVETAVMLTDMVTTGLHGAELADIQLGESVVTIGIGPVGLMAVAGATLRGAARIFAVGSRPICQDVARFYGATDIINYKNGNIVEQIMEKTSGKGVDKVIIAGGGTDVMIQAVKLARPGGVIANVNYFIGDTIPIPVLDWGYGMAHKDIRGGICPGGRLRLERLIEMVKYNRIDPSKLVTHVFHGLENIEKALLMMKDKPEDMIKPVVIID